LISFSPVPDDPLPSLGVLVAFQFPRLFCGKVFVEPPETVHRDCGGLLELKGSHVRVGNRRHLRDVKRPVCADQVWNFRVAVPVGMWDDVINM